MNSSTLILIILTLGLNILLYNLIDNRIVNICELEKCPYCFGTDFCDNFKLNLVVLKTSSLKDFFNNYFSVKNVFHALFINNSVVIKKLAHSSELNELDDFICFNNNPTNNNHCVLSELDDQQDYYKKIIDTVSNLTNFKVCSPEAVMKFLHLLHNKQNTSPTSLKHLWTVLQLNAEPLLLQILKYEENWPVPQYLGACGRVIVESDCGPTLNYYSDHDWHIRANLSLQLLRAAGDFTRKHSDFRFYLTDISPDNIAVSPEFKVTFIDLENVILTENVGNDTKSVHYSEEIEVNDDFAYSEDAICQSSISDHNYYAICKLLLSKNAPWPMMDGGLLHSPPHHVNPELFASIENCVTPTQQINRFEAATKIVQILQKLVLM